jgi:DNA polymerase-3 subunit epsilon
MTAVRFASIDVETANSDLASVCQIGVATFEDGKLATTWETLVDPEDEFDGINVSIHGIDEELVQGAPTLPKIYETLSDFLEGQVVVSHTCFDRTALRRAHERYSLKPVECTWIDSARVARRAWPQFAQRGYGLANVASTLGINFRHHDALEDARAAGEIMLRAVAATGIALADWNGWLNRAKRATIEREGDPDGLLAGEIIVFTGALLIPRRTAADMAAKVGCDVATSVTRKTTLLVVGDQDARKLAGEEKSSKHRKAQELIKKGCAIRIITESDFWDFVNIDDALQAIVEASV